MLTRCSHCHTTFRVTAEQLKVRQGKVRCGACRGVFDALESLRDEAAPAEPPVQAKPACVPSADEEKTFSVVPAEAPPVVGAAPEEPVSRQEAAPQDETAPAAAEAEDAAPEEPVSRQEAAPQDETAPAAAEAEDAAPEEPVSRQEATPQDETAPAVATEEPPMAAAEEKQPTGVPVRRPPRRWPWLTGCAAMLLLAAAQLAYFLRSELAVLAPDLRPVLAAACDHLGCTLPRPVQPSLVSIESSDLAPAGEGLLLTATLKNRAPFAQDYPHLELTLTDTHDEALVRKVLAPADYLPAGQSAVDGFAAGAEATVRLAFMSEAAAAVGYRLYLFYP